ncbi:glycoside hydrolase family 28 protein [Flavobacterium cellulosilyticum]|uniref:Glycoside hydrolase family 28 protein n=1 Tax=Flavobacterium cellulosilyticum TaxID=2541731 RepID=A0A4R5C6V7_9FLAO|nr:glycosyl hydrolase family 28 protein [Flavobacterium cellulosilyticum]TDD94286.1 glycoside hydrolase family 28 protein [Flavobacterium cellulosilyticum]
MSKIKGKLFFTVVLSCLFLFGFKTNAQKTSQPQKEFLINKYGAVPDGITLNTQAIQKAIDAAFKKNKGGCVVFPKGAFLSGSIQLKSNVSLNLQEGAVLLGSTNPLDYKKMDFPGRPDSPKKDDNSQLALLLAHKANAIKLFGKGKIDGQGLQLALTIDSLHHAGIAIDPNYSIRRNRPNETMRPKLFRFSQCNDITITDLQLGAASCWGLSFELCTNLTLDRLTIVNRSYWNNDGIDITDCKEVKVINCNLDTADDGICLKSYYPGYANDGIYIANCTIRSSASAIKFGTASYGGFKNVVIKDIQVFDTFRSAIAIESVDGGIIENISVSNITALNTGNAIFIRLGHRDGEKPGVIRNVTISNVKVQVPFGRPDNNYDLRGPEVDFFHNPFPSSIVGIPGYTIENVVLENIEINLPGRATKGMAYIPLSRLQQVPEEVKSYPEFSMFGELPAYGFYIRHVNGITMKNIKLTLDNSDFRPAFVFDDVQDITMNKIAIPDSKKGQIILKNSSQNHVDNGMSELIEIN